MDTLVQRQNKAKIYWLFTLATIPSNYIKACVQIRGVMACFLIWGEKVNISINLIYFEIILCPQ